MKRKCFCIVATVFFCMTATTSWAELSSVGIGYGQSFRGTGFEQYNLQFSMDQPSHKVFSNSWGLRSDLEVVLSILTWDGDTAFKPSVMRNIILSSPRGKVDLLAGIGVGVMFGDTVFSDDHDLGGPFFFQSKIGFHIGVSSKYYVGYHYYHQSNGRIYNSNDSVNSNHIELVRVF